MLQAQEELKQKQKTDVNPEKSTKFQANPSENLKNSTNLTLEDWMEMIPNSYKAKKAKKVSPPSNEEKIRMKIRLELFKLRMRNVTDHKPISRDTLFFAVSDQLFDTIDR